MEIVINSLNNEYKETICFKIRTISMKLLQNFLRLKDL